MSARTPTPWSISKHGTPDYAPQFGIYADGSQNDLAIVKGDNAKQDAALIVRAVNSHDKLRGMLKDGALQFSRLTGEQLEAYARTWAVLSEKILKESEVQS